MVRRVTTLKGRSQHGRFSIEGIRHHERALRAGVPLELVLIAEHMWQDKSERVQRLLAELETAVPSLITIPNATMTQLTASRALGGLLGLISLPTPPDLRHLLTTTTNPLLLIATDIIDPGNVGALLRTGHASGITAFITIGRSDPFHPQSCAYRHGQPVQSASRAIRDG